MSAARAIAGFEPGARFGGYRLVRLLGRGGFAHVWLAIEEGPHGFEKPVALKVLTRTGQDSTAWQTLINEARVGSRLRHPNIVDIYRMGEIEGTWHIAMEYVDGGDLDGLSRRARDLGLSLPASVVLEIGLEVARALDYAHTATDHAGQRLNLVHRDLKPANVLLGSRGAIKVADFGIAKAAVSLETTTAGILKGTPYYMAPEIWAGERSFHPRIDLFAVGVMLAELAIGQHLFQGDTPAAVAAQVLFGSAEEEAATIGEHAPALVPVLRGLLQRKPERRTASAADAVALLQQAVASAQPPGDLSLYLELLTIAELPESLREARAAERRLPETDDPDWARLLGVVRGEAVEEQTSRWRQSPLLEMMGGPEPEQLGDTTSLSELVDQETLSALQVGPSSEAPSTPGLTSETQLAPASLSPTPLPPAAPSQPSPIVAPPEITAAIPDPVQEGTSRRGLVALVAALVLATVGGIAWNGLREEPVATRTTVEEPLPSPAPEPVLSVQPADPETAEVPPAEVLPAEVHAPVVTPEPAPAPVPTEVAPTVEVVAVEAAAVAPRPAANVAPAPARAGPGCLVFRSMPPGAEVTLDGAATGLYARSGDRALRSLAAGAVAVGMGQGDTRASAVVTVLSGARQVVTCTLLGEPGCTVVQASGGCG